MTCNLESLVPQHGSFPTALTNVADASPEAESVRLVSGARGFDRLPQLTRLRRLWCFSLDGARLAAIARCASLEELHVDTVTAADLSPLAELTRLRLLSIDGASKVATLNPLGRMTWLAGLRIESLHRVHDLEPLRALVGLAALWISGASTSLKPMLLETLAPLSVLASLRALALTVVRVEERSVAPLHALTDLRELVLDQSAFPMAEYARLAARLPAADFAPWQPLRGAACSRCGQRELVVPIGSQARRLCRSCDAARVARVEEAFIAARGAARTQ